ncbi:hypothetical protein PPL_11916 [Heterostelium album PN500]|uniref:BTB domain-containing protein n=1 Tax=Heterostelium pallidum (strain ATCC 26659 / Pp 5 / PN500) TaxID=670386 RepID=D3BUU4_HETP5|nr:hypothetical protein PPL_11916 [Heterostelium album PN500]EFA74882.1 hypothetical protein PPL_11916 [Heterostelium album PN500]|eukprot:XP_020427016.1 hypothetical protein PPL_11916 [Heterostelium album PN500]
MSEGDDGSDPISEAVGFIENILQPNIDLQYQGLKGLMLCSTTHVVELFKNPSFFYHIKRHPNHKLNHISSHGHHHQSSPIPTGNAANPGSNNSSPSSSPSSSPTNSLIEPCNQSPSKYSDIDYDKYSKKRKSTLKSLIELCLSETKKVQSSALRLLWHLSAQADLKVLLYEEGVLDKLKYLISSDSQAPKDDIESRQNGIHRTEVQLASSAILQNITEYRFERGEINPNQVKIVNEGIVEMILLPRSKSTDRRVQFLTTLTIANLSMNEENHQILQSHKAFDIVESFVTNNSLHMDLVYQYKVEVWKGLSVNNGVQSIFLLLHSPHPKVVELAKKIAEQLQIEEPSVTVNTTKIGTDLKKLFNNSDFSDICFVCEGKKIYAHKAICASRCEQLRAMFTWGKESQENEIHLPHIPYASMYGVLDIGTDNIDSIGTEIIGSVKHFSYYVLNFIFLV